MPFALDISNVASGVSALPIDYVPPVVTVGGSPSGTLPNGVAVAADVAGHADLWWPRGLPCALLVRPIIEHEGFMRSGGVVIGGATTRLVSYHYEAGPNDASDPTRSGTYPAACRDPDPVEHTAAGDEDRIRSGSSSTSRRPMTTGPSGPRRLPAIVSVTVIYSAISQ